MHKNAQCGLETTWMKLMKLRNHRVQLGDQNIPMPEVRLRAFLSKQGGRQIPLPLNFAKKPKHHFVVGRFTFLFKAQIDSSDCVMSAGAR
jgi:hypothetical protein